MIITGMSWLLSYAFAVPMNPDYQYKGSRLAANAEQCVEAGKEAWRQHYARHFPDWVEGDFSVACWNKKNHYEFRSIICDKTMNCEVK